MTRDSFISVCWRLVPYWLNNWEQNWGTECSSMLFEVPRFAVELLVILPCVQVGCGGYKVGHYFQSALEHDRHRVLRYDGVVLQLKRSSP